MYVVMIPRIFLYPVLRSNPCMKNEYYQSSEVEERFSCRLIKLRSWKGDYLHRPDTEHGVTTWPSGIGNEWVIEFLGGNRIKLRSWKGDYLHRPDTEYGVTTWPSGIGNEWVIEFLGGNRIKLRSWKGDYLHRPDTEHGVTTWFSGIGNEWEVILL